jgi:DUF4097 and DUF4098 domain-containing protein YvlB
MARVNLHSSESPEINIESVSGSLQIKSWDDKGIRIEAHREEDLKFTFNDDTLELSCDGDCVIRCPESSELSINAVSGNAVIAGIETEVNIANVSGSLTLKGVGGTSIGDVSGTLTARNVEGDLTVKNVSGNATLRDIEGDVQADEVSANISLREIEGEVFARCSGNADLHLSPEGHEVDVEASGNMFCFIEEGTDAEVFLESDAEHIQVYTNNGRQVINGRKHQFTLGDGGSEVRLKASGHIDFRSRSKVGDVGFDIDLDLDEMSGLADEISEQVTSQVEGQLESLNEQLEALSNRLRNSGDRAARNAQRHVEAAQRRLQHKLHMRQTRMRRGKIVNVGSVAKNADPVSVAERALILQMVQDKKVSVDEAEMLLNALEGREKSAAEAVPPVPPVAPVAPVPPVPPVPPKDE